MHPDWAWHLLGLLLMWAGASIVAYAIVAAWLDPYRPLDPP